MARKDKITEKARMAKKGLTRVKRPKRPEAISKLLLICFL